MIETSLEGVESIRVIRAAGNLKLARSDSSAISIDCDVYPEVRRSAGTAELSLMSNAEVRVPANVAVEVVDCSGNLDVKDVSAPLSLGRIGGNLDARGVGSVAIRSSVHGNLEIAGAQALECDKVGCNARVYDVEKAVREAIEEAGRTPRVAQVKSRSDHPPRIVTAEGVVARFRIEVTRHPANADGGPEWTELVESFRARDASEARALREKITERLAGGPRPGT